MKILVTGSKGFVGKNLISELANIKAGKSKREVLPSDITVYEYDVDTNPALLNLYTQDCDFVFHLAGVNRPETEAEYMEGNFEFTDTLLSLLEKHKNRAPILVSSSVQAQNDTPYGASKKAGEDCVLAYGEKHYIPVYVYRLPNLFGKWCRPNYNSVTATFCYNIANGKDISIHNPDTVLTLAYIDDVIEEFLCAAEGHAKKTETYCEIPVTYTITLGKLAELILGFAESRNNILVPISDAFSKKLYSTYLSYLEQSDFSYPLTMHADERGTFAEILKTPDKGQFSVNVAKPGVTKGNHWHHTKCEKFVVVKGEAIIRFRKVGTDEVIEYPVSGNEMKVVDIPVGYAHHIENTGEEDAVFFIWCNECFDKEHPDTYFEEV